MWVQFWDMHSGGSPKEKWTMIYIEAESEEEAEIIFYNKFGHNPHRVTCTCCGPDYSTCSHEDLAQLTGYHRNCRPLEALRDEKGRYINNDPAIKVRYYLEDGEEPPPGYRVSRLLTRVGNYQTLEKYKKNKYVRIISKKDIRPEEREGALPEQGYVWVD